MLEYPEYLDRIDELEKVMIVRFKGKIDQAMIPVIEKQIQKSRSEGDTINKNVLVDYASVDKVDSAAVAFHLVHLKEYEMKGFRVGFINVSNELHVYLNMFQLSDAFKIYENEESAVGELNQ